MSQSAHAKCRWLCLKKVLLLRSVHYPGAQAAALPAAPRGQRAHECAYAGSTWARCTALHSGRRVKLVGGREESKTRTRVLDQVLAGGVGRPGLGALEQVWVVAALAQLHHDVEQPRAVRAAVHRLDVLRAAGGQVSASAPAQLLCKAGGRGRPAPRFPASRSSTEQIMLSPRTRRICFTGNERRLTANHQRQRRPGRVWRGRGRAFCSSAA